MLMTEDWCCAASALFHTGLRIWDWWVLQLTRFCSWSLQTAESYLFYSTPEGLYSANRDSLGFDQLWRQQFLCKLFVCWEKCKEMHLWCQELLSPLQAASSSLLPEVRFLQLGTSPAQVVPLHRADITSCLNSSHLLRVTGRLSRQHSSTSRIVGSLCPTFCGGTYCISNACMCLLSLWIYQTLAYKKYCVLRKDTGAKKGPRGPMRVLW